MGVITLNNPVNTLTTGNTPALSGYHCHPNESDGAYCIDTENVDCSSIFYSYIDGCKKYPYDLMNLDKTIDMMVNPSTTFYDLND